MNPRAWAVYWLVTQTLHGSPIVLTPEETEVCLMAIRPFKDGRSLYVVCRTCGRLVGGLLASLRDHLREHDMVWGRSISGHELLMQFDESSKSDHKRIHD